MCVVELEEKECGRRKDEIAIYFIKGHEVLVTNTSIILACCPTAWRSFCRRLLWTAQWALGEMVVVIGIHHIISRSRVDSTTVNAKSYG
jgi:hypothetical protein